MHKSCGSLDNDNVTLCLTDTD